MEENVRGKSWTRMSKRTHRNLLNSNSIIEHYKDIDRLKDDIDSFIPEEVIK